MENKTLQDAISKAKEELSKKMNSSPKIVVTTSGSTKMSSTSPNVVFKRG